MSEPQQITRTVSVEMPDGSLLELDLILYVTKNDPTSGSLSDASPWDVTDIDLA